MQTDNTMVPVAVPIRNGVIVLGGYGVKVAVDRRQLHVEDGVGRQRREARFAKATTRLKRLLVIAQTGFVSLEALRWLNDAGAAFVHLDYDATILTASIRALDDARLRRAQAVLPSTEHAVPIAREILEAKIRAQLSVVNSFDLAGNDIIQNSMHALAGAKRLDQLLRAEAEAAEAYWEAWSVVSIEFARRERAPDHWRAFGMRRSPITQAPRKAANPLNAMLNYLYTLLEAETCLALLGRGLDPGLGLFHSDVANRQSFAADVMEPVRPHVDAFVLNLARTRTFSTRDFCEMRDGSCRLGAALSHELAASMTTWAQLVTPYAEAIARRIGRLAKAGLGPAHPATGVDRARVKIRVRPIAVPPMPKATTTVPMSALHNACRDCGAPLTVRKRIYCDPCTSVNVEKARQANVGAFVAAGHAKIAKLRAEGYDPSNTPEARQRHSKTMVLKRRAQKAWQDDGSLEGVDFRRDILPHLERVPVRLIAEAMSCGVSHAAKVRSGVIKPHKRHWNSLRKLTTRSG